MYKWNTHSVNRFRNQALLLLAALIMASLATTQPVPAQLGMADLKLQEIEDRRSAHVEISSRMQAVLVILAEEFNKTRDQAVIEHHRTNTDIHSQFGTLGPAAAEAGLKVHLCAAGSSDLIRRDWLIVWYDPTPALRNIATPEEVRFAKNPVTGARITVGNNQLFWIEENALWFEMAGGRPVPNGLADCHAALDANTVGVAIQPRMPVIKRRVYTDRENELRYCPPGEVGGGIMWQRNTVTILTGHDEPAPVGFYSAPEGPPDYTETAPGSAVFRSDWFEVSNRACAIPIPRKRH